MSNHFGYSQLNEDTSSSATRDSEPAPWTANFDENLNTSLTDTSQIIHTSYNSSQPQNGGTDPISGSSQTHNSSPVNNSRNPRDNVKYTALKPTRVEALQEQDRSLEDEDPEVFDSYIRMRLTADRVRKPLPKQKILLFGLLITAAALVVLGLIYVFVIVPAHNGHIVYPDGKMHNADLIRLHRLGDNVAVTSCGLVRGSREKHAYVFRGIPYANPPTGHLRWKPSTPKNYDSNTCWSDVYNATTYGNKCVQPKYDDPSEVEGNEDCLYLNVWTPYLNPETLLPVMVWLHSGDFVYGSGNMLGMTPNAELAVATNSVYVSLNYRLGAFGFMALDELRERPRGPAGNYGFMDQQLALKWVRENIGHFGGNRDKVTIFGHGSGATSVQALLSSPGSTGLFQKAWLTSPVAVLNKTLGEACEDNKVFMTNTGCDDAECLRHLTVEEISKASPWTLKVHWTLDQLFEIPHHSQLRNNLPIFDGHVVHKSAVTRGPEGPVVPVVMGTTYYDLSSLKESPQIFNMTWDNYDDSLVHHLTPFGTEAIMKTKSLYTHQPHVEYTSPAQYPALPSAQFARLIGDIKSVCPVKILAADYAHIYSSSAPVYMYVAEINPSHNLKLSTHFWDTFVGWDVLAFFNGFDQLDFLPGQGDVNFQNIIREEIMSFVKEGQPDASRWGPVNVNVGVIGRDVTVSPVTNEYFNKCDHWRQLGFFRYTWLDE